MSHPVVNEIVSEIRIIPAGLEGSFFMKALTREKATDLLIYIAQLEETVAHGKKRDQAISQLSERVNVLINGISDIANTMKSSYPDSGAKKDLVVQMCSDILDKVAKV